MYIILNKTEEEKSFLLDGKPWSQKIIEAKYVKASLISESLFVNEWGW